MLDELKSLLQKSQARLDEIVDKMESAAEDWSEDAEQLWLRTRIRVAEMQDSLSEAAESLKSGSEEAQLQAHLAAMDASDQWQHLNKVVSELSHHTVSKTTQELQHAQLQAHLAAMETRDFVGEKGPAIRREFSEVRDKVETASVKAAKELEKSLEKLGDIWAKTRH